MGGPGKALTLAEIISVNRRMAEQFGGQRGLLNPASLDFVLDEMQGSVFGVDRYPEIIDKAGLLGWRIIKGHFFLDANKRTGIEVCKLYLALNNFTLRLVREEVLSVAVAVADGSMSREAFTEWLRENCAPS